MTELVSRVCELVENDTLTYVVIPHLKAMENKHKSNTYTKRMVRSPKTKSYLIKCVKLNVSTLLLLSHNLCLNRGRAVKFAAWVRLSTAKERVTSNAPR